MIPSFVPKSGPLVVRTGLGQAPENHRKTHHLPMTKKDFAGAKPNVGAKTRFGQLSQSSFFARHNPQPNRVRHIKGLLDLPICTVNDGGFLASPRLNLRRPASHGGEDLPPVSWSYPLSGPRTAPPGGRSHLPIHSMNYHPNYSNPGLQKHKVNLLDASKHYRRFPLSMKERADPKFGMIPITDSWRDELRDLTERTGLNLPKEQKEPEPPPRRTSVYSADTGRLLPPPSRAMSRGFSRNNRRDAFTHIVSDQDNEVLVLEMLCQILQTDSMQAVQSWLMSSGDREKDLVLDMIQSALSTEQTYFNEQNNQEVYDRREQTARPLTTEFLQSGANDEYTEIPNMMNVQNGYGELDRPIPPSRDVNGYSRYSFSRDGERAILGTSSGNKMDTIYDEQAYHPSLRQSSHKSDIFKVNHESPRSQSKAEVLKIIHPPSPPTKRRPQPDNSSSTPPQPSSQLATTNVPKVRYTQSALDIKDEDLKRHTLTSILKEERNSVRSTSVQKTAM